MGSYIKLEKWDRFGIKRIIVKPGEVLSLQRYYNGSEHWVVIKRVTLLVLEDDNG